MTNQTNTTAQAGKPGPAQRFDSWKVIGPGGGGTMMMPTISPHNPNLVAEYCDMTGAYITTDGGESWRMFNLRVWIQTYAFDPGDPETIYAGNVALWRSQDKGKTWSMIWPDPAQNTVEHMVGDHADVFYTTDDPSFPKTSGVIRAIAVAPSDSSRVYVAYVSPDRTALYLSEDRGSTWKPAAEFSGERIQALYIHPDSKTQKPVVYAVSQRGVHRGKNGRWDRLEGPGGRRILSSSAGSREGGNLFLYTTTPTRWEGKAMSGGIFVSEDGGRTWKPSNRGLEEILYRPGEDDPPRFGVIACSSRNPLMAYVSFRGLRVNEGPENLYNGIAKTSDGGKTWNIVHRESNRPSTNLEGSWVEGRAPDGWPNIWFDAPGSLGVAPTDGNICYATDLFRTYRTLDGGKTWKQVNSVRMGEDRWTTRGLDVTTCYGVHFDPFDIRSLYITYTDIGLFRSEDGGASWTGATEGIPNRWRNTTYWIEFDPEVKGLLWGAFGHNHDLPRPKMWRGQDPAGYRGGVAVSADGGRRWTLSNEGIPETAVTHILLDPTSLAGARILYACGFGRGVYKSTDSGKTWTLKNNGIEKEQPFAWRIVRSGDGTLYLIIARRSEGTHVSDTEDGTLCKSTDGGDRWVKIPLPGGCNAPTDLAIDPTDNRRMYLTAWGVASPQGDINGGVFLSTDGGQTWKNIHDQSQHVYAITIDPKNPKTLYICGFDSSAYRSTDGGGTWQRIKGYNFKWGHRVILDPADPEKIYITTFGGSVWHGPAAGNPDAVEDVTTKLSR